jgi:hypothetical protein
MKQGSTHILSLLLARGLCIEKFNSWVIIIIIITTRVMMKPWQQSSNETEHPSKKGKGSTKR